MQRRLEERIGKGAAVRQVRGLSLKVEGKIMKRILVLIIAAAVAVSMVSCEVNDEIYNDFRGGWHLVRINVDGEYRKPFPNNDSCFNVYFMENNSMMGQSVNSTFSSIYNIRKKDKIVWSGFTYIPVSQDSTDNIVFMEDLLKVDHYSMRNDTLKFLYDKKTYLTFVSIRN